MRLGTPLRIVVAAGALAAGLVGLVVREGVARAQGQEVRLAMAAYDPRALLTGHYVAFELQDSAKNGACPPGVGAGGLISDPRWVALSPDGDRHRVSGASRTRDGALRLGEVAVRGSAWCRFERGAADRSHARQVVRLHIGVERFHADQAQAQAIERELMGGRRAVEGTPPPPAFAVVSIGRDGKARLKGAIVGRRRIDLDWL